MNKTKIPWADYSVNSVKGLCPVHCRDLDGDEYCYARAMYHRFKWDTEIRYDPDWALPIARRRKPSRIFMGSTFELFLPSVTEHTARVIQIIRHSPLIAHHTFIFLTKRPWELAKYNPWPENCWVGASATDGDMAYNSLCYLGNVEAPVRFLSCEPLLEEFHDLALVAMEAESINWLILGGRTGRKKFHPPEEWIREIEDAANAAGIPVFEKDNLRPSGPFRQEFPALREVATTP